MKNFFLSGIVCCIVAWSNVVGHLICLIKSASLRSRKELTFYFLNNEFLAIKCTVVLTKFQFWNNAVNWCWVSTELGCLAGLVELAWKRIQIRSTVLVEIAWKQIQIRSARSVDFDQTKPFFCFVLGQQTPHMSTVELSSSCMQQLVSMLNNSRQTTMEREYPCLLPEYTNQYYTQLRLEIYVTECKFNW